MKVSSRTKLPFQQLLLDFQMLTKFLWNLIFLPDMPQWPQLPKIYSFPRKIIYPLFWKKVIFWGTICRAEHDKVLLDLSESLRMNQSYLPCIPCNYTASNIYTHLLTPFQWIFWLNPPSSVENNPDGLHWNSFWCQF